MRKVYFLTLILLLASCSRLENASPTQSFSDGTPLQITQVPTHTIPLTPKPSSTREATPTQRLATITPIPSPTEPILGSQFVELATANSGISITDINFSPDGRELAVAGGPGLWVFRVEDLKVLLRSGEDFYDIDKVSWSPDGRWIAANGSQNSIRLVDPLSGKVTSVFGTENTSSFFADIYWSPDGRRLAIISHLTNSVVLWYAADGDDSVNIWNQFGSDIPSLAWAPDSERLAYSTRKDQERLVILDVEAARPLMILDGGGGTLAWSPDGRWLASQGYGKIVIWNMEGDRKPKTAAFEFPYDQGVYQAVWSPDSRLLALGSSDGIIQIWDINARQQVDTLEGHKGGIMGLDWSPDGSLLASGAGGEGILHIWGIP